VETFVIAMTILQVVSFIVLTRHVLSKLAKAKAKDGLAGREARLVELYGHVEELMDVFEAYIDEVRQDVEKDRAELTELSRQAAVIYTRIADTQRVESGELRVESADKTPAPQLLTPSKGGPPRIVRPAHPAPLPNSQLSTLNSQLSPRDLEELGRFATKPQKVRFLMGRGLALEDVARALGVGTGEVRLIAELEK